MDKVLAVNDLDFDCRVQAGVTWRDLNTHLRETGLWFPVGQSLPLIQSGKSLTHTPSAQTPAPVPLWAAWPRLVHREPMLSTTGP